MQLFRLAFSLLFFNKGLCSLKVFGRIRLVRLESKWSKINRVINRAYVLLMSCSSLTRLLAYFRTALLDLDICLLYWSSPGRYGFSYYICLLIFTVKVFKVIIYSKALTFLSLFLRSLRNFSFSLRHLRFLWLSWGWATDSLQLNLDWLLVIRARLILEEDLWYALLVLWTAIPTQVFRT